jgi:hypothetical protein
MFRMETTVWAPLHLNMGMQSYTFSSERQRLPETSAEIMGLQLERLGN